MDIVSQVVFTWTISWIRPWIRQDSSLMNQGIVFLHLGLFQALFTFYPTNICWVFPACQAWCLESVDTEVPERHSWHQVTVDLVRQWDKQTQYCKESLVRNQRKENWSPVSLTLGFTTSQDLSGSSEPRMLTECLFGWKSKWKLLIPMCAWLITSMIWF